MLDKRLNDKGKNWRHVLKALKVLDYCLHEGSELVVTWAHKNIYIIKTLREFQYIDEDGRDVGQNGGEVFKRLKWLWLTSVSSPCFCEGTDIFNPSMRRDYGLSAVIERPGSLELQALKSLRSQARVPLNEKAAHTVRSAPTKRMPNTDWLLRQANIKKKKTERSAKAEMESLTMRTLQKL